MKKAALSWALAALFAGCAPRNQFADRILGIDSITNGRSKVNPTPPASPP